MAWEAVQDNSSALVSATFVADPEQAAGSWLWHGAAQVVVDIWGINPRVRSLCLSL